LSLLMKRVQLVVLYALPLGVVCGAPRPAHADSGADHKPNQPLFYLGGEIKVYEALAEAVIKRARAQGELAEVRAITGAFALAYAADPDYWMFGLAAHGQTEILEPIIRLTRFPVIRHLPLAKRLRTDAIETLRTVYRVFYPKILAYQDSPHGIGHLVRSVKPRGVSANNATNEAASNESELTLALLKLARAERQAARQWWDTTGAEAKIDQANARLLELEAQIAQPFYGKHRFLTSLASPFLSMKIGRRSLFWFAVPGGNVANPKHRHRWETEALRPRLQELHGADGRNPTGRAALRQMVVQAMKSGAEFSRLRRVFTRSENDVSSWLGKPTQVLFRHAPRRTRIDGFAAGNTSFHARHPSAPPAASRLPHTSPFQR
jgi:hypothetical protein